MDILLNFDEATQTVDLLLVDGDLALDDGLKTSAIISLGTEALADPDDALPGGKGSDRRGWWGDSYADHPGDSTGTKDWLLWREKQLTEVLERYRQYGADALEWMLEDGLASAVDVTASMTPPQSTLPLPTRGIAYRMIVITSPDGSKVPLQFPAFWGTVNAV